MRNPKGIEEEKSTMDVAQLLKMVKETPELKEMLKQIINEWLGNFYLQRIIIMLQ